MGSVLSRFDSLLTGVNGGRTTKAEFEDSGIESTPTPACNIARTNRDELILESSVSGDPRSPGAYGLLRTPLPGISEKEAAKRQCHQQLVDPRSPTMGIDRTPICSVPKTKYDANTESSAAAATPLLDPPHSPSCERSSVLADCDVHKTWEFSQSADADSLYVNSPSFAVAELDLSSDASESGSNCRGSMENLLNDSTEVVPSEDGPDAVNQAEEEPAKTAENGINVSPIGSPVRASSAQDQTVAPSVKCSTPNLKPTTRHTKRGLSQRDTNSPLSIVQRKQISKLYDHISTTTTSSSKPVRRVISTDAVDKENALTSPDILVE